ncbi:MAG: creatininase family protein [Ruminococcaceae bacterium]|nr:creatininase family protein [Oscillospiraceae bacterium]
MFTNLNSYTWEEISRMDPEDTTYVLPISALEQHGRHLAIGADDFILASVLKGLYGRTELTSNFLCLPTIHYGNSHEHLAFRGVISLGCETIVAIVRDILKCMQMHGFKKLAIINSHGGNTALLEAHAQEWEVEFGVKVFTISFWSPWFFRDADVGIETPLALEIHAGEMETSILQYSMPQMVRDALCTPELDNPVPLRDYYQGWLTCDVAAGNGAMGCASKASAEKGERLIRFMDDKITAILAEIQNWH